MVTGLFAGQHNTKLINSLPCMDFKPGTPGKQAAMLTIELWRLDKVLTFLKF